MKGIFSKKQKIIKEKSGIALHFCKPVSGSIEDWGILYLFPAPN